MDEETTDFVLRLEGTLENGASIAPGNLNYALLVKQLEAYKKLLDVKDFNLSIEEGSFILKTAVAVMFGSVLASDMEKMCAGEFSQISSRRQEGFRELQELSREYRGHFTYGFGCEQLVSIPPAVTQAPAVNIEVETILEGKITDGGGTTKSNIHLNDNGRKYTISVSSQFFDELKENIIHKQRYIRVKAQYNLESGEYTNCKFIEFVTPGQLDMKAVSDFIEEATTVWSPIEDHVAWVQEMRGGKA